MMMNSNVIHLGMYKELVLEEMLIRVSQCSCNIPVLLAVLANHKIRITAKDERLTKL